MSGDRDTPIDDPRRTIVPPLEGGLELGPPEPEVPLVADGSVEVTEPAPTPEPPMDMAPPPAAATRDIFASAKEALERARAVRGAEPAAAPLPSTSQDPFAAAREALQRASAARGAPTDTVVVGRSPRDPLAAAQDVLERARAVRERSQSPEETLGQRMAEAELRRIKRQLDGLPEEDDTDA